jgi:YD repeat-containing protein
LSTTSAVHGQNVTLTASVTGGSNPTGTVKFFDNTNFIGSAQLSGGNATLTQQFSIGSHSLGAQYLGDSNNSASFSSNHTLTVTKATEHMTEHVEPSQPVAGEPVTIFVDVTVDPPSDDTATGDVTVYDNGTVLTTLVLDGTGEAEYTITLGPGAQDLTFSYAGDGDVSGGGGTTIMTTVQTPTATTVTAQPSSTAYGEVVAYVATVTPQSGYAGYSGSPTGDVTFTAGGINLGSATVAADGTATLVVAAAIPTGNQAVVANYSGDTNFQGSQGTTGLSVAADPTVTTLFVPPAPSDYGQSVTLKAQVSAAAPGSGQPTGSVEFAVGSVVVGSASLNSSGIATLVTSNPLPPAGTNQVVAIYGGDADFDPSSDSAWLTVNRDPSTTELTSPTGTSVYGQPVTLSATVSDLSGVATPSGSVTFYEEGTPLGSAPLSADGQAELITTWLGVGSDSITASYSGDNDLASSGSSAVFWTVNKDGTQSEVSVSVSGPATYGQDVTLTAAVTADAPGGGVPTGTVTFYDGDNNVLGTAQLQVSLGAFTSSSQPAASATLTTAALPAGDDPITVRYAGDGDFTQDTSPVLDVDVEAVTYVELTPHVEGPELTLDVAVDIPTGSVVPQAALVLYEDGAVLDTVPLTDGEGSYTVDDLSPGTHTFQAFYQGDLSTWPGQSDPLTVATTTTTLSLSAKPAVYGQPETLTATITGAGGTTPTDGLVDFYDNGNYLGLGLVEDDGTATLELKKPLSTGAHNLTASYEGLDGQAGQTSYVGSAGAAKLTINWAPTTVTLTPLTPVEVYGQPTTFVVKVAVNDPGTGTPTGNVGLYDNSTYLGAADLINGSVTVTIPTALTGGPHALSADYGGDGNYAPDSGYAAVNVLPAVNPANFAAIEGVSGSGLLTDLSGLVVGEQYRVETDWGDGTPTDVQWVTAQFTTASVYGTHLYRTVPPGGAYPLTVTVTDPYTQLTESTIAQAFVADQQWGITGVSPFTVVEQGAYPATGPAQPLGVDQPFSEYLGYLWDNNPLWQTSDYQVTINYGDGTAPVTTTLLPISDPGGTGAMLGAILGEHTYTSAGTFVLTVTVVDLGNSSSTPETLTNAVTVLTRPYPVSQSGSTTEGTPVVIDLQSIEPDGHNVTYQIFSSPANGTVTLNDDQVLYTPNPGFTGVDQFLFQAWSDGLASNLGGVRIDVQPTQTTTDPGPGDPPADTPPSVALADSLWVVHAGETPTLQATASDVLGASDITDVEWDFNYDGSNFVPDPAGAGTLTPACTFATPGIYVVAVQVTNSVGETATDVGSVQVLELNDPAIDGATPEPAIPDSSGGGSGGSGGSSGSTSGPANPDFNPALEASPTSLNVGDALALTATAGSGITVSDQTVSWDFNYDGNVFQPQASGLRVLHAYVAPGVYTVAADISDGEGDEQIVTETVQVADVPTLVVLPPADQEIDEGQPASFAGVQAVDLLGNADPTSIQWDFNYSGTFVPDPSGAGVAAPSYQYPAPGNYVAAVQVSDDNNHTAIAFVNVQVDAVPPDVSAGGDLTVGAGQPVTFQGSADAPSAITDIEWDFNYDGQNFVPDPAGAGTLTPTHTFLDPGTYDVALQVTDADGLSNLDVATVTVSDVGPTGQVTLSATNPDASAQTSLTAGSPVYFAVSGMEDVDPNITPSVWADWNGDGNFSLVTSDQWQDVSNSASGESLLFSHVYDAPGTYSPVFHIEDAEGNYSLSDLTVTVADATPSGTFGSGQPVQTIASTDTVSFTNVTDPSQSLTDAGFTYYYQVDGGGYQASDSPDFTVEGLPAGTTHTIQAYIQDADGGTSPVYTQVVQVQGDVDLVNSGTGVVQVNWVGQDNVPGSATVQPGTTYTFADEPQTVNVTLLTSGASYDLSTNGSIDAIDGSSVTGATLEVHTDDAENLPDPVGDGHIGPIVLGANSTVTVGSRGDFGGLVGTGLAVTATSLEFDNLTGPITGVLHIGTLQANGTVGNVSVADGIDDLEAYALGNVAFETDPLGPATASEVIVGPGGVVGALAYGHQAATLMRLDANGEVTSITDPQGNTTTLTYTADGAPATLTDAQGTYTFTFGGNTGNAVLGSGGGLLSAAAGFGGGTIHSAGNGVFGWISDTVSSVVQTATTYVADAAQAVGNTIQNAYQQINVAGNAIVAQAVETFAAGVNTVTYYVDQAGSAWVAIGDAVVNATRQAAEAFTQQLEQFGKSFTDLWAQLKDFGNAAGSVLSAIMANPAGFFSNLASGVGTGIQNFINNLGSSLQSAFFQWLAPGLSGVTLPTDFTAAGLGQWLLGFFRLDWPHIRQVLTNTLGAGNVALVNQAYQYLSTWVNQGASGVFNWLADAAASLTPDQLVQQVLQAGVDYITQNLVPKAVAFIVAKFAVPAVGIVSGIYDTVKWLFSSLSQFQQLAGLATQIVQQIGDVVAGNTSALASSVTGFLNGLIPVGITFLAAQLHLSDLPQSVGQVLEKVRNFPLNAIQTGVAFVANKARQLLGLNNHSEYQGLLVPAVTFNLGAEQHRLWAVDQNGVGMLVRASNPTPVTRLSDLLAQFDRIDLRFVSLSQQQAVEAAYSAAETAVNQYDTVLNKNPATPAAISAQQTAAQALEGLARAMTSAAQDILDAGQQIVVPPSQPAPPGITPAAIAAQLGASANTSPAYGALAVGGRVYWLTTSLLPGQQAGRYNPPVIPPGSPLIGRFGITNQNRTHIEVSAAVILRRLALSGATNLSGAYVVVNQDYICGDPARTNGPMLWNGCFANLESMLPTGVSMTVCPCTGSGSLVIAQPRVRTFIGV